ncbi:acetyltransferase [Cognaticolwellia mytili]|uniref:acetyltransferase n=1 Tax=Cognaticolwellia mytili TaxID=1888913 RepID=UPI000A16F887|nr:acetyltransferase [Cognaticolwellia mytili]
MNKNKTLVIIGAGGHGRVVADCAEQSGEYTEIVFLDDSVAERKHNAHWAIIDTVEHWINYRQKADFIVALGNNAIRASIQQQLQTAGVNIATIVHPTAAISKHCQLGKGVVVFANAVVNVGTEIADGCIINTGATVDHDCHIGQYCHLSPGVNIAGGVRVERMSWLGIGCSVIEGITIAENSQMGAGAVITQNTKNGLLYLGVPAKAVRAIKL